MPLSKIQDIGNQVVPNLGLKNAVINGAMQISQRSTSEAALGSGSSDICRTVDRIKFSHDSTSGRLTMSQNSPTDLPGFTKSVKLQVTTALSSPAAGNYIQLKYIFEGQQLQQFAKGTSSAKVMALSFYVKGNGNATYMCELEDHDNGRNNQQQFSVTSSWNRVQLLYAGDTTGAFGNDVNASMSILFWLVAGSTYSGGSYTANTWASPTTNKRAAGISNLYSSTSNFIEITGLQLEPIQVTEFQHESFDETLIKCQRYYQKIGRDFSDSSPLTAFAWGYTSSASAAQGMLQFERRMRIKPTFTQSTDQNLDFKTNAGPGAVHSSNAFTSVVTSETSAEFTQQNHASNFGGAGQPYFLKWNGVQGTGLAASVQLDAEL